MNEAAYKAIIDGLQPVSEEIGLAFSGEDEKIRLSKDDKSVAVTFDEKASMFQLRLFDSAQNTPEEGKVLSSWLFDSAHSIKDAKAIAGDFEETLREEFGIKPAPRKREVALPSKGTPGSSTNPEALAQKFLAIYPAYKEEYKAHVEKYGEFLYEEFFTQHAVPKLREVLKDNNKKQVEKFITMLDDIYTEGDLEVASVISFSIITQALYNEPELWERFKEYVADRTYLKSAAVNMMHYAKRKQLVK